MNTFLYILFAAPAACIVALPSVHYITLALDIYRRKQAARLEADPTYILRAELDAVISIHATQPLEMEASNG